ncbi:hypothetical protein [Paracoccus methylarcula]|uniref:hypothetical protein n=1 Tax=Paracoccus methylarcula TaxID=72022 RepID=UPI0011CE3F10|nr:hypothetical protein [Paracoccus methylarcula]
MTVNPDTGEEPICPLCGAEHYGDCGHLVADIDNTFGECLGGELYDRDGEFYDLINHDFLHHLSSKTSPSLVDFNLQGIWEQAAAEFNDGDEDIFVDRTAFIRMLTDLLEDAGGSRYPGPLEDSEGPGMTSSITLIFASNPKEIINISLQLLKVKLR